MPAYTLFGQMPAPVANVGVNPGTAAVEITVDEPCKLRALWLNSGAGFTMVPATIALFDVTGEVLDASQDAGWSGGAASGWIRAPFASPPLLQPGTSYRGAVYGPASSFGFTAGQWAEPITSGPLSAGTDQGWYSTSAVLAYPDSQQAGWNWWVDTEVVPVTKGHGLSVPLLAHMTRMT